MDKILVSEVREFIAESYRQTLAGTLSKAKNITFGENKQIGLIVIEKESN
jgi:hypothetical protein